MTAENRDITLARLGKWYLHDLDAAAVKHCQRKIVNTAKAKRRYFQLAGIGLGRLFKISPGFEFAVLLYEDEGRAFDHHCHRCDVVHCPPGAFSRQQGVTVSDVDRHRVTVGGCRQKLPHAGRTGAAGDNHDRDALTEHWLQQLADKSCRPGGASTRTPWNDQFNRTLRIAGRNGPSAEQPDAEGRHREFCEASPGRTHGLLPTIGRLLVSSRPRPYPEGRSTSF